MSEKIEKALILTELGRLEAARDMLAEVLAGEPEDALALARMADLCRQLGEYERALEFSASALRVTPDSTYVWRVRALSEFRLGMDTSGEVAAGHRARAVEAARHAVELDPSSVDNLRVQATTQWDTDPSAALQLLDRALELDPDNAQVHVLRGLIFRWQLSVSDKLARAEAAFREALRLEPEHSQALYELALITRVRGDLSTGTQQLRRVAELDPEYGGRVREQLDRVAAVLKKRTTRWAARVVASQDRRRTVGYRFRRFAAIFVALMLIRVVIAAVSHDSSTPPEHNYYSPPPTFPSYLQHFTLPPMPTWPPSVTPGQGLPQLPSAPR
ncbi:tetratricopeptide repeat protein [Nocardia yunnanensis]|uniref:Tetratricopeptide repeat protein n=1 Tax=Nocardia yunnanensis TaxID=2382165 RepID=A0A386Z5U3_9NOCA|nr:tetratricopeptide repeat protein [Nocardia yunnanensis]AYF73088.1 tetratricopeptide repeat protein [Nocardia yunnanensis]